MLTRTLSKGPVTLKGKKARIGLKAATARLTGLKFPDSPISRKWLVSFPLVPQRIKGSLGPALHPFSD